MSHDLTALYERLSHDDDMSKGRKAKLFFSASIRDAVFLLLDSPDKFVVDSNALFLSLVVLGINADGRKEVPAIVIGENESSRYWPGVLNGLKNRGVKDILIPCPDGLSGIKEAVSAAFPATEQQRCIVHMVRNTLKYAADKDMKAFAKDLKTIYTAADGKAALKRLDEVTEKWKGQYPGAAGRWYDNWDAIATIFKFSKDTGAAFYTTNSIESLNASYRRLNRRRSVFPSPQALLKALYLAAFEAAEKWTVPIRDWGKVYGELAIMYEGRLPQ